jgi:hypothetical protein
MKVISNSGASNSRLLNGESALLAPVDSAHVLFLIADSQLPLSALLKVVNLLSNIECEASSLVLFRAKRLVVDACVHASEQSLLEVEHVPGHESSYPRSHNVADRVVRRPVRLICSHFVVVG